jgi:hypothetical protein
MAEQGHADALTTMANGCMSYVRCDRQVSGQSDDQVARAWGPTAVAHNALRVWSCRLGGLVAELPPNRPCREHGAVNFDVVVLGILPDGLDQFLAHAVTA